MSRPAARVEPMTAEQLLALREDGAHYELREGELHRMNPPGHFHGSCAYLIGFEIGAFVRQKKLGKMFAAETGFLIAHNPDTVRAPDAAFVSNARLAGVEPKGYFPGAPDLAVEVTSPNDTYVDVQGKSEAWLAAGTEVVIVVDPERRSVSVQKRGENTIRLLREGDTLDGLAVLPGFSLAVAALFE